MKSKIKLSCSRGGDSASTNTSVESSDTEESEFRSPLPLEQVHNTSTVTSLVFSATNQFQLWRPFQRSKLQASVANRETQHRGCVEERLHVSQVGLGSFYWERIGRYLGLFCLRLCCHRWILGAKESTSSSPMMDSSGPTSTLLQITEPVRSPQIRNF